MATTDGVAKIALVYEPPPCASGEFIACDPNPDVPMLSTDQWGCNLFFAPNDMGIGSGELLINSVGDATTCLGDLAARPTIQLAISACAGGPTASLSFAFEPRGKNGLNLSVAGTLEVLRPGPAPGDTAAGDECHAIACPFEIHATLDREQP